MSSDGFEVFAFSKEEAEAVYLEKEKTDNYKKDPRICVCGHPVTRHKWRDVVSAYVCKPNAMQCPCAGPNAVLEADDTRFFVKKTTGVGPHHALSQGVLALLKAGKEFQWTVEKKCSKCERETESLTPVTLSAQMVVLRNGDAGPLNALLCGDCFVELTA